MSKIKNLTDLGYSLTPLHQNKKLPLLREWNTRIHANNEMIEGWKGLILAVISG